MMEKYVERERTYVDDDSTDGSRPWDQVTVPETMVVRPTYPVIQWINRGGDVKPAQERGGFYCAEKFGGVQLPGGVEARYHKDDGSFSHGITVAILAMRTGWFVKQGEVTLRVAGYREGARRRVEALVLLRDDEHGEVIGPVKITVVGLANSALPDAYRALTTMATAAGAQPWMFWVHLTAGQTEEVGPHAVEMTPVCARLPRASDLPEAFIGFEAVQKATALAADINTWREAWAELPTAEGQEVEEVITEPETDEDVFVQAQAASVNTQRYGEITLKDLMERDAPYARRVMEYIADNASNYNPDLVSAASLILDRLPNPRQEQVAPF